MTMPLTPNAQGGISPRKFVCRDGYIAYALDVDGEVADLEYCECAALRSRVEKETTRYTYVGPDEVMVSEDEYQDAVNDYLKYMTDSEAQEIVNACEDAVLVELISLNSCRLPLREV